jgi:hypothetical protein
MRRRITVGWNKVKASIHYKSGWYQAYLLADSSLKVGDKARCLVLSGYEANCEIRQIVQKDVDMTNRYAKTIGEPKLEEDIKMVDQLFVTVVVSGNSGFIVRCKATYDFEKGTKVVYEGSDDKLHVGTVLHCIAAGDPIEEVQYKQAGFIAHIVDTTNIDICKDKLKDYNDTMAQLKIRKKQFEENEIYELLAQKDSKARELLDKLNALKGGN